MLDFIKRLIRPFVATRRRQAASALVLIAVAAPLIYFAWWLISPLFTNEEVDEAFPVSAPTEQQETGQQEVGQEEQGGAAAEQAEGDDEPSEAGNAAAADGQFPLTANATIPEGMSRAEAEEMMEAAAEMEETVAEAMMEAMEEPEVVAVLAGEFEDGDPFHTGEGSATVYRLADGTHVVRFEDFRVRNGPDLRVILTPVGRDDVLADGYIELGELKGNIGNQNYFFPEGTDPDDYAAVIIFCWPFRVVFAEAVLGAP